MERVTVAFLPEGRRVQVPQGTTILEAAQSVMLPVRTVCGGDGECGKCKMILKQGDVERFDPPAEEKHLTPGESGDGYLLACRNGLLTDAEIFVPPETRIREHQTVIESRIPDREPDPPGLDEAEEGLGLALDVGTTKIGAYLVDLPTGEILGQTTGYNDQMLYGEEVLSRIKYARDREDGLERLQALVVDDVNRLIDEMLEEAGGGEIRDVAVAGNAVMNHILVGRDPSYLAEAEREVPREPFRVDAADIGLNCPGAEVYCLPNVSRYLGGDGVANAVATDLLESEEVTLIVDLGTNGEILLGGNGVVLTASCAAGPAFEGYGISSGMRAAEGAVESVSVDPDTLGLSLSTIGDGAPRGICGSGLIDLAAELHRAGALDRWGTLEPGCEGVREGPYGTELLVVPAEQAAVENDIVLTERDIEYLMDSKAALCASVAVLIKKLGVPRDAVKRLYVTGAFGHYVDLQSLAALGGIPRLPNVEKRALGNGSIAGAYLALISRGDRATAEEVARVSVYYDLTTDPDFVEEYTAGLSFPEDQRDSGDQRDAREAESPADGPDDDGDDVMELLGLD